MARYQVKPREDGNGSIYRHLGDGLTVDDTAKLISLCDKAGFDMRRVA